MLRWHILFCEDQTQVKTLAISGGETTCGRDPSNDLSLSDRSISRSHLRFCLNADRLVAEDLGSRSGTFVNSARISGPVELDDGDRLRFGRCHALVRRGEPSRADADLLREWAMCSDAKPLPGAANSIASTDGARVVFELPAVAEKVVGGTESPAHLSILAEVGTALRAAHDADEALSILLGVCFDLLAPERGAILVADGEHGFVPAVAHPEEETDFVLRSILERAATARVTVVAEDAGPDFVESTSVRLQAVRSVACCPMIHAGRVVGAIYLDARSGRLNTRREDIGLLGLIAGYAATAIENSRLARELEEGRARFDVSGEPLIAESMAMQQVVAEIGRLARGSSTVVIEGEAGTGKFLAARHLHAQGPRAHEPFRVVDGAEVSGQWLREILGSVTDASAGARRSAPGTLVLRNVGAVDPIVQPVLAAHIEAIGRDERAPRVLVTSRGSLHELAEQNALHPALIKALGTDTLRLPRLRDRREDVLPLARHFLRAIQGKTSARLISLEPETEPVLMRAKFHDDNVQGLRRAVELAAMLTDGNTIRPEHLFTGPVVRNHRLEFDLGRLPLVQWLVQRPIHDLGQFATCALFVFLVIACVVFADSRTGRVANGLVWGLWWPGLLLAFVLLGRVWCSVCPLSRLSRLARRLLPGSARAPGWMKTHTGAIMAALFVAIVWGEAFFDMPNHPLATGIFLLTLLAFATVGVAIFEREAWCRHGCPLGSLAAGYSVTAPLHVHANPAICTSECRTHECYKGNDVEAGCPMFIHPMYAKDAHLCKLCLSCVRNCPNRSARLWLRVPLQDVWTFSEFNPALVPVAWIAFLVSPVLLAFAAHEMAATRSWEFTAALLVAVGMAGLLAWSVRRWLDRSHDPMAHRRVAFSMLLLAWGPLMAFHLGHVPGLEHWELRSDTVRSIHSATLGGGIPVLVALQAIAIAASAVSAVIALTGVRHGLGDQEGSELGWRILAFVCVVYTAANAALVF